MHWRAWKISLWAVLLAGLPSVGASQDPAGGVNDAAWIAHQSNAVWITNQYQRDQAQFADDADIMVRRGLLASRDNHTVHVYADSTGLSDGDTIEYYLIGEGSSHAYEALAISFAAPAAIREALEFIGMTTGRGVDYERLQLWPKGERVRILVEGVADTASFGPLPLESLLWGYTKGQPVSSEGFVFTGSRHVPIRGDDSKLALAADKRDPFSVISDYNEPDSILDVPFRATKGDAYGDNTVNARYKLKAGSLLRFVMRPEHTNGFKRVLDLDLQAYPRRAEGDAPSDVAFSLVEDSSGTTNTYADIVGLLAALSGYVDAGRDPFATLAFSRSLNLRQCQTFAQVIAGIETEQGVRIEPPLPGALYYRAFIPEERLRDRAERHMQPLELHLRILENRIDGYLVKIEETWGTSDRPTLKTQSFPLDFYKDLPDAIQDTGVDHPILLIYANAKIQLGPLLDLIAPIRDSHTYIHIYLDGAWPCP